MGLDTTHDCWHGSYGGFKDFRDEVAAAARQVKDYVPRYNNRPLRAFYGWWDDDHPFDHILDVFFVHSDCEGYIFPQHAGPLADALEELVESVPSDEADDRWSWQNRLRQFIAGLRSAADEWQIVEFR